MALFRRRRLPAGLRPPLDSGERVVAWATTPDGQAVVATNLGLWLPGREGRSGREDRLGWHEIHKAAWSGSQLTIIPSATVRSVPDAPTGYDVVADAAPVTVSLPDPSELPHQVRARVTRSVGYTAHHRLPGGGAVRVVGRRVPGRDGVSWAVRYEDGAAVDDPGTRSASDEMVAQARASMGLGL
jgi:hypothetical protein